MATPEMRERRRAYPLTNIEHQAYCVMQWLSGLKQREIAVQFGYGGPAEVNIAIMRFISAIEGEDYTFKCQGHVERKPVAKRALMKFIAKRAAQPGSVGAEWMRL